MSGTTALVSTRSPSLGAAGGGPVGGTSEKSDSDMWVAVVRLRIQERGWWGFPYRRACGSAEGFSIRLLSTWSEASAAPFDKQVNARSVCVCVYVCIIVTIIIFNFFPDYTLVIMHIYVKLL